MVVGLGSHEFFLFIPSVLARKCTKPFHYYHQSHKNSRIHSGNSMLISSQIKIFSSRGS